MNCNSRYRIYQHFALAMMVLSSSYAVAQHNLPMPGYAWAEIRSPASAQAIDRDNAILEGAFEQGFDLRQLSDHTSLNVFGKLDYTFDTEHLDYNQKVRLGAGLKLLSQLSASSNIAIGAKYEIDRRFIEDRSMDGPQLFVNWYGSWRLPKGQRGVQQSSKWLALPGTTWGEVRYPGSQLAEEADDVILEGEIEQGVDWLSIHELGTLNTFVELDYIVDSKGHDWNNAIKLGLGAKLKKRTGKGLLQIGAKYVADRRWVTERTDEALLVFVSWSTWWNPLVNRQDLPNK